MEKPGATSAKEQMGPTGPIFQTVAKISAAQSSLRAPTTAGKAETSEGQTNEDQGTGLGHRVATVRRNEINDIAAIQQAGL